MTEVITLEQLKAYIRNMPEDEILRIKAIREEREETEDE